MIFNVVVPQNNENAIHN